VSTQCEVYMLFEAEDKAEGSLAIVSNEKMSLPSNCDVAVAHKSEIV
jgi:hypothetical protein